MRISPSLNKRIFTAVVGTMVLTSSLPLQTSADALTVVRLGLLSSDNSANAFDALELGYFKTAGLDVQITTLQGGPVAAQSVAGGALDIGTGNIATLAAARAHGVGLKFIAPASVTSPTTMTDIMVVAKDSPYKSAADLNGKTIGINALKALPQVSVSSWMDKHGGDSKSVKFVELAFSQMGAALAANRIDAALEVEPFVTNDKAEERVLGPAIDGLPRFTLLGFFASDAWLTANPDVAAKFVAALRQASVWANGHRRESGAILSRYTKIDPAVIAVMGRAEYGLALDPAQITPIVDGAFKYGIIDKTVPAADLIWETSRNEGERMSTVFDGGEAILEALRRLGTQYLFSCPGSEWPAVWEALARQRHDGTAGPAYIDCWHETLTVNMAMGYTNVTQQPQVVLLHSGAGLLQGSLGIRAAQVSEIPMLVMSGESLTNGADPAFDPGEQWYRSLSVVGGPHRLVEPIVKWSTQVTSSATLYETVVRAVEMCERTPTGPIFLNVPLETLLAPWTPPAKQRAVPQPSRTQPVDAEIAAVANLLLGANDPVIVTSAAGRDPEGVAALVELAELLGAPVVEGNASVYVNFPKDHPLHLGYDVRATTATSDAVLLVKERAPWYPLNARPANATIVAIDENPLKAAMAYQELQADTYLEGNTVTTLRLLTSALRAAGMNEATNAPRRTRHATTHDALIERLRGIERKAAESKLIEPAFLCAALNETMPDDAVYVEETTVHRAFVKRHLMWSRPQSYFNQSGLGQGLGVALGVKLALPDRPVISLIGDGAFLYNPVLPCLGASRTYELPILIVIFNNKRYQAMQKNHLQYYPDGACKTYDTFFGVELQGPDYAEVGATFGFHGETVDDPKRLVAALREALAAVTAGRTAIVNVMLDR